MVPVLTFIMDFHLLIIDIYLHIFVHPLLFMDVRNMHVILTVEIWKTYIHAVIILFINAYVC